MKIKEILTINLEEDIKNVIDLEDIQESEIQSEIENYIITDGLANDFESFISTYLSNKSGTGVWISGFYGSGKSYFGKILGYLLSNATTCGTPARERILQRFTGIKKESLVKNTLSRLNSTSNRVVFLDIAKQISPNDEKKKNLAHILFMNFLKSLDLPANEHGILLYHLLIKRQNTDIKSYVNQSLQKDWSKIKIQLLEYASTIKKLFMEDLGAQNEDDYQNIMETIRRDIDQFSSSRLKEELTSYLKIHKTERIVFLFDEASEAINQQKINLLDLEGVSEALSALAGQVWTIAIAQEKLDDVINNARINRAQLTKVTDRFQTKIHLEATEIDEIIRQRLLNKKINALDLLKEHFDKNAGKIANHALLSGKGISKTDSYDSYSTYYPFYKHQFDLMQNFLFGTKGLASTKVAARGMIITTYDILKRELQNQPIFDTATGWQIATQAQPQPPVRLVNRYDNAERVVKEEDISLSGRNLLKTIHFLAESEVVPTTLQNIVKSMSDNIENHTTLQKEIEKSLQSLVEAKILLFANQQYRITSDLEQRYLDEMGNFTVQMYMKKKRWIDCLKNSSFLRSIQRLQDGTVFSISSDNDDDIANPGEKHLRIKVLSLYNMNDNRQEDIERIKIQYQNEKGLIWLVPDNKRFEETNQIVDSLERLQYLLDNYPNPQGDEKSILQSFQTEKLEKENQLKNLAEESLSLSTAIYLFNTELMDQESSVAIMHKLQNQMIKNVYNKKPATQLSDDLAGKIIKETMDTRLSNYFSSPEYGFFDKQGNFIGNSLKVTEEVVERCRQFMDGKTLEKELAQPPTGFSFGTVITTIAVLVRAGKMIMKYNGQEYHQWKDPIFKEVFETATKFRNTSFKSFFESITAEQRKTAVAALLDLKINDFLEKGIDYNANVFEIAFAIRDGAKHFINFVENNRKRVSNFNALFSHISQHTETLSEFTGLVSDTNVTERITHFLEKQADYQKAIKAILEADKFVQNSLKKVQSWNFFIKDVLEEIKKSSLSHPDLEKQAALFFTLYQQNLVENYKECEKIAQLIHDAYFNMMKEKAIILTEKYEKLANQIQSVLNEINSSPKEWNLELHNQAIILQQYAKNRIMKDISIHYTIQDQISHFTLSDIISSIALSEIKATELQIIQSSIQTKPPPLPEHHTDSEKPKQTKMKRKFLQNQSVSVKEYRDWLKAELQSIANLQPDDEIEWDTL